ncbi:8130_t:CDS:2, partial [Diversispora eburnea]
GYLDFEDEMHEYHTFALNCQQEIESISKNNDSVFNEQKHELATQIHQIVWHSITHNFSFSISYMELELLDQFVMELVKIEHIKSWDWIASKHTGEKNFREIMFENKEISWKHIKGVYEHTSKHVTSKVTKLTKRHIWLTSWSKMRVDLAEQTLSKEVEDALESIDELK